MQAVLSQRPRGEADDLLPRADDLLRAVPILMCHGFQDSGFNVLQMRGELEAGAMTRRPFPGVSNTAPAGPDGGCL